jgi:hypothetical protein
VPKPSKSESVPAKMRDVYEKIVALTDDFCARHLNEEYAALSRRMAATLARKRPSPLLQGQARVWAGGIVYAVGRVNFLFDRTQQPHLTAQQLCDLFGVSQASASARAKQIFDALDLMQLHPEWTLPSKLDQNPLAWFILVNGIPMDARHAPREIQEEAVRQGVIPYLPETSLEFDELGEDDDEDEDEDEDEAPVDGEDDEESDEEWAAALERDPQFQRIRAILGATDLQVTEQNLKTYLSHLTAHLTLPCQLTGIEDFPWEERYVFGYGSQQEYEELKKTRASYTDQFELLSFEERPYAHDGILVQVKRISDGKRFKLPLADLKATSKKSPNYQLLDDYAVWFVNFR